MKTSSKLSWIIDSLSLLMGISFFYALFLGSRVLAVPDEARYSEIPREMVASGHYLIPHLNYIKYFEKPDLYYWLQALSIRLFGLSEWSLRFWSAALGVLGCVIVYLAARKLFNRRTGIYSSLILASSMLYYGLSHFITLDNAVAFFISTSLLAFLVAVNEAPGKLRRTYIYLTAIAAALAVLTKGLIGLVFPCMIIGVWIMLLNNWKLLAKIYLPTALLLFLMLTLPWHILMATHQPGWAYFYFVDQQFLRYSTTNAGRYQPMWFFIPILALGLFPWISFLPQAIKTAWPSWRKRDENSNLLFLLLWAVLIFVFFSISQSKLIPYILPVMAPLAILIAYYLAQPVQANYRGVKWGFIFLPIIAALLGIAILIIIPQLGDLSNIHIAKVFLASIGIAIVAMSFLASLFYFWKHSLKAALLVLLIGMSITLPTINLAIGYFDNRSVEPLAAALKPLLKKGDQVIVYENYYQDLPFYLRQGVVIVDWNNELTFGMQHQNVSQWVWTQQELWQKWQGQQSNLMVNAQSGFVSRHAILFMVMTQSDFKRVKQNYPAFHFYLIAQTSQNVLVANQEINP